MSRYRLNWYELEELDNGDYSISFPVGNIYSEVLDQAFPEIENTGWQSSGNTVFRSDIECPSENEVERLRSFLDLLKEILLLRLNRHLEDYFDDELDQCFALDFNLEDPETYTGVGALEYEAKYNEDRKSADKLAELLATVCSLHPNLRDVDHIAAVPGNPGKRFHLPGILVKKMGKHLEREVGLDLEKTKKTTQLKNLSFAEKIETLKGVFSLGEDVEDQTVLLIDDLYQSGTTMWTLARFLKENGADSVYGLACVKSWRDSDNI